MENEVIPNGPTPLGRRAFFRGSVAAATAATSVSALAQAPTIEAFEDSEPACRVVVEAAEPTYGLTDQLLNEFIAVSESLTGVSPLDRNLGRQYLERYAYHPELSPLLPSLVQAYTKMVGTAAQQNAQPKNTDEDIKRILEANPNIRAAAEQLVYLWYVSAFFLKVKDKTTGTEKGTWVYGTPEQYEAALLWPLIRAHAPMTHGGPYGYWADAPSS